MRSSWCSARQPHAAQYAGDPNGDAKAQNILVDADDRPVFIDLDGAGFSALPARRRRQAARDQARFQRNWEQFRAPE